jgi:hypothetical protein
MTSSSFRIASPAVALALAGFVATGLTSTIPAAQADRTRTVAQRVHSGKVSIQPQQGVQTAVLSVPFFRHNIMQPAPQQVFNVPQQAESAKEVTVAKLARPDAGYYSLLRSKLRWVDVRMGEKRLKTPDPLSRVVLAQSAAYRAGLHEVGLSFRDVYGIINAETSWIPRMGASKNGTPNLGIAQFEPATAKALGLRNPHDPVEAVHVAALHLKQAAVWSAKKIDGLRLPPQVHAAKLREGVSIYYNLSTKGRNQWNGLNTAKLPIETRRHISNAALGAREAASIEAKIREMRVQGRDTANAGGSGVVRTGG